MSLHAMDPPPVSGGAYGETGRRRRGPLLVVGYDGSPNARAAVAYAVERAGTAGQVLIVHACRPADAWFGAPSYQPLDESGHALAAAVEREVPPGVWHETLLLKGSPPSALQRVAAERDADEIVIGAHGSDEERRGLGSVPLALLGEADRPVVIIPSRAARRYTPSCT